MSQGVSLVDDDRARVPFAVIGAFILVSAATIAAVPFGESTVDRGALTASDRTVAAAETTVREATQTAGAVAAANPVVEPAGFGRVLEDDRPFRSYLELLVYAETQQRLDNTAERVAGKRGTATLPPVTDDASARTAIDRTTVEAAGNGSVRVRIEGLDVRISRDDRVISQARETITVTAATPVLTMHNRVNRFETRLNRSPAAGPGLGRGLTGRLYAMGWARGWAQWTGAPIKDVIAHRHVELAAASSAIDQQRVAFGTSDPAAEQALARATAKVAAKETLPGQLHGLFAGGLPDPNHGANGLAPPGSKKRDATVAVDTVADEAFEGLLDGDRDLTELISAAHDIEAKLAVQVDRTHRHRSTREPRPPGGYRLIDRDADLDIERVTSGHARSPQATGDWQQLMSEGRQVTAERTITETYSDGRNRSTRELRYEESYRVGIAIHGHPVSIPEAPSRPVVDLTSAGDPPAGIDGPTAAERAEARLITTRGGVDQVAETAVEGEVDERPVRVEIDPPNAVMEWVYADVAAVRETVRDIEVHADRTEAVTGANPAAGLAQHVHERTPALVDAPPRYQNRPHRAVVAARAAYLEQVIEALGGHSDRTKTIQDAVVGQLGKSVSATQGAVDEVLEHGADYVRPEAEPIVPDSPATNLTLAVETEPAYPTRKGVTDIGPRGRLEPGERHHPLGIRTTTIAAVPVDEITNAVLNRVFVGDTVSLSTAAEALRATDDIPHELAAPRLAREQATLRTEVAAGLEPVERAAIDTVVDATDCSYPEARTAVEQGLTRWPRPAYRVKAMEDGNAAAAIAAVAADDAVGRDRVATRLRVTFETAIGSQAAAVPEGPVSEVITIGQEAARTAATEAVNDGVENVTERLNERFNGTLPITVAGIPLVPFYGTWWTTVNGWGIEIQGEYPVVAVRSPQGAPTAGGQVTYVRDGTIVQHDITGDGHPEYLGRSSRVAFQTWTVVIVAVPGGKMGVGNKETPAIACSDGWAGDCIPTPDWQKGS